MRAPSREEALEARAWELAELALPGHIRESPEGFDAGDMLRAAGRSRPLRIALARLLRVRQGELDSHLMGKLQELIERHRK